MPDRPTSGPRRSEALSGAEDDARIEHLLVTGLDHYFAGEFEAAINLWTRVLFLDRNHDRARAYIDRARSAQAEQQRISEALVHEGLEAFDKGEVVRARALAKQLGSELAIIDKRRPRANVSEVMHVIGEIEGRNCVVMDDMIDTAGTLVKAAEVLKERGAKRVFAYCTHPIFSGQAIDRIAASQLDEVVITNTIPLADKALACKKVRQLSVALLFAETIRRISDGESVTSLFSEQNNNF